jgi:2-amino-4-hydroxy-6-hydroxymethyldihydropteridine diphosphokinase
LKRDVGQAIVPAAAFQAASTVYLGLGSNVGNREANLLDAVRRLHTDDLRLLRVSSLYETEPMGFHDQPWFLNQVAEFETELQPLQLLQRIQNIENTLGRKREIVNGPRTIDIDILLFGGVIMKTAELTIPHPRYRERRFVLEPLLELDPASQDPETQQPIAAMLNTVHGQAVRRRQ